MSLIVPQGPWVHTNDRPSPPQVICVLVSIGGVFTVSFYSTSNKCSPPNGTNSTTHPGLYDNDDDDSCKETSTPLGYVVGMGYCYHANLLAPRLLPQFLVVSVITYAMFETLYKKFATKKDDPAATLNGLRFLGYIGVHTVFWLWPPFIVLHITGFETFAVPYTMELFGLLVLNAFMDIVFNGCLLVCIALSSPLYAS